MHAAGQVHRREAAWCANANPTGPAATIPLAASRSRPMPKPLQWTDVTDIAILLAEKHPEIDPLSVRFTDLHAMVMALPGFTGDPKKSGEKILEAIQMAWVDEVED